LVARADCPYRLGMLVDVAGQPGTPMAALAQRSADTHYRRIPTFVRAYFATKKLDEFATDLVRRGKLPKPPAGEFSVGEVLQLLDAPLKGEREKFFGQRISSLVEDPPKPCLRIVRRRETVKASPRGALYRTGPEALDARKILLVFGAGRDRCRDGIGQLFGRRMACEA
jgi:hypothetical protein